MRLFKKNAPDYEHDLKKLEMQLKASLRPVSPRTEFVRDLGAKLVKREIIISPKTLISKNASNALLVIGGVVGSFIMIITSIRGLISILGVVGYLLKYFHRNSKQQQISPV